jgi:hypothetical protein
MASRRGGSNGGGGQRSGAGGKTPRSNRRVVGPSKSDDPEKRWQDKAAGASRAGSLHRTKAEAMKASRERLKRSGGGELTLQNEQGVIIDSDTVSPGSDPNPPRDRK